MNIYNKETDKKLQELENQSLPDLSKMDEHWQQMGLMLQPQPGSASLKNPGLSKKLLIALTAMVIVGVIAFLFLLPRKQNQGAESVTITTQTTKQVATDTPWVESIRKPSDSLVFDNMVTIRGDVARSKLRLERFYESIQKKPLTFTINTNRDTVIYGKEGTMLTIPANSFDANGPVTILMTEVYSIEQMIKNKLTTTCDGRQLISGGMIYLDAVDKDENLVDLRQGALLRLDMPVTESQFDMQLFYGDDYYRNDNTTVMDSINWTRTNQPFRRSITNTTGVLRFNNSRGRMTDTIWFGENAPVGRPFDYYLGDSLSLTKDTARSGISKRSDSLSIQRFGVNINRLGWINCDRFYNDSRPRVELIVDLGDNPDHYNTMLVFDDLNSILPRTSKQGNIVRFSNVPSGAQARIVIYGVRNEKMVTAMKKLTTASTTVTDLKFEEIVATAKGSKKPGKNE